MSVAKTLEAREVLDGETLEDIVEQGRAHDRLPLFTAPHEITIHDATIHDSIAPSSDAFFEAERAPRESSVVPIRVAAYARGVSDSLLVAPTFPRSASTPRLEAGRDFTPSPGELGWEEASGRRLETLPAHRPRAKKNIWPALVATFVGFAIGVLIAWLSGAL